MKVIVNTLASCVFLLTIWPTDLYAESDWKLFDDPNVGYSFSYPSTWEIKTQRTYAFRIMVADPNGTGSCMLKTNTLPPQIAGLTAEEVIRQTSKQDLINGARQHGTEMNISVFKSTKVANRPAIYYEDASSFQSLNVTIPLRTVNVVTKAGALLYTLSCVTTPEDMERNKSRYTFVLQSLVIRKPSLPW